MSAAPSLRSETVVTGLVRSNEAKNEKKASVSLRCDSAIFVVTAFEDGEVIKSGKPVPSSPFGHGDQQHLLIAVFGEVGSTDSHTFTRPVSPCCTIVDRHQPATP